MNLGDDDCRILLTLGPPWHQLESKSERKVTTIHMTPQLLFRSLFVQIIFCFFATTPHLSAQSFPAGRFVQNRSVTVYLVLEGEPVASSAVGARSGVALASLSSRTKSRAIQVQTQQATLQAQLESAGAQVTGRFLRVANAIRVRVPQDQLPHLAGLPGVKRIEHARLYHRLLTASVPFVGAPSVWSAAVGGADGRGVRVGIIDSGIDYTHADFGGSGKVEDFTANDPTRIEPGSFPTAKVVGGFDFAGDSYNPFDDAHATPIPDPDPLDCALIGHGSHVAGIASGFGVLKSGQTYTGGYSASLDLSQFSVGPGVAPRALLYALKVFGCEGPTALVTDALEWAADPNGDFDFSDRLDVVNLSLGGEFGSLDPEDSDVGAANRLAKLGCVVVCAAGNDENIFYTIAAPSIADRAISVANVVNRGNGQALQVTSPSVVAGNYYFVPGDITESLTNSGPISGKLVYMKPNLGCVPPSNAANLNGNIALIDRGTCFFSNKILNAQEAGATAVVVVNNQDATPTIMGGDRAGIRIPGGMISKADGELLKAHIEESITIRLDAKATVERAEFVDTLHDSTSRGPGSPGSLLKPDISAPGTEIVSVKAGSGTEGIAFTGTSMASPTVAGAAALLRQLHPSWPVEDIKAALMNSAKPITDATGTPYPESRMGAGRLQVDAASRVRVTAAADDANGSVSVSFGALALAAPYEDTRAIRLTNHSNVGVTYQITVSNSVQQSGISFRVLAKTVSVPPNGSASVSLRLTANPEEFEPIPDGTTPASIGAGTLLPRHFLYEASGQVLFTKGPDTIHVPFYANARAASDFKVENTLMTLSADLSTLAKPEVTLRFNGASLSTNIFPLVSAFQLGATSPDKHITDPNRAMADLIAVGAATDFASVRTFADTTLYFGLATSGPWTSPQPNIAVFEVLIDTDNDGLVDFVVFNDNASLTNSTAGKDVFVSGLIEIGAARNVVSTNVVSYLNVFAADELDTAVFNNNVMVLSAPAALLGLTKESPAFRYRVLSFSSFGSFDDTDWIPFDAAHPVIDTTDIEGDGTPLYEDGAPLKVRLDREVASQSGQRLPRVLLLHHFGLPGKRVEIVTLDLANDDVDADRLVDWWELKHFGLLGAADLNTDIDRDGVSDHQEFLSGTDPRDWRSALKIHAITRVGRDRMTILWSSVEGQTYALERSENLAGKFTVVGARNVKATPPLNSVTDSNAFGSGPFFYRVRLQN